VRGVGWTFVHQLLQAAIAFGAMLLLVRILAPADYGRAAAVAGILTVLNAFGCASFVNHGLQLPDGGEPDWSGHLRAGIYIQLALSAVGHAIAAALWFLPAYAAIAPLLHVGAVGLLIDAPSRVASAMLRRELAFRRLRAVQTTALVASTTVTLVLAVAGAGAYALVIGLNVVVAIPFIIDLLILRGWRPASGWWRWPDWGAYSDSVRFGIPNAGSGLLHSARGGFESAVLPAALGFAAMGLLGRAQALFLMTIWRVVGPMLETVYPLLPRSVSNPAAFRRNVTLLAQIVLVLVVPGAAFLGLHGPTISRVLYGARWAAADPLLLPAAVLGIGMALFSIGANVTLAMTRMRRLLYLNGLGAGLAVAATLLAPFHHSMVLYAWSLAAAQVIAGAAAFGAVSRCFEPGWVARVLVPPAVVAGVAAAASAGAALLAPPVPAAQLAAAAASFTATSALALRVLFPAALYHLVSWLPNGRSIAAWLQLQTA
jgi:O-antigen/teichoic acid export membrane protein